MAVLHRLEGAPNHCVLKVRGPIHSRHFARKSLPHSEVLGAPSDTLPHTYQSGGNPSLRHGRFAPMDIAREMHFHTSGEIEASFNRGTDQRELL